jgi:hypothetical protein
VFTCWSRPAQKREEEKKKGKNKELLKEERLIKLYYI